MRQYKFSGKALTLRQPWASAVAFAGKDIENRPLRWQFRGLLAIHAGLSVNPDSFDWPVEGKRGGRARTLIEVINQGHRRFGLEPIVDHKIVRGRIIAIVTLVDCVEEHSSPWFSGPYGYVLKDVVPIEPVKKTGMLGLWNCSFKYRPLKKR